MPGQVLVRSEVEPLSLIPKLVKSCKGAILDPQELENFTFSLQGLEECHTTNEGLDHVSRVAKAALIEPPMHDVECFETTWATDSIAFSAEGSANVEELSDVDECLTSEPPAYILTWFGLNKIDYHLYLAHNERGMDDNTRRNSMFMFDGDECRPCPYSQLSDLQTYYPNGVGKDKDPIMLINCLPVRGNPAVPADKAYILGFDFDSGNLFVRQFAWLPEYMDDVWCVWNEGFNRYEVQIKALRDTLRQCIDECELDPGVGILSKGKYVVDNWEGVGVSEDPGMELVIVIKFCLWVVDMAEPMILPSVPGSESLVGDFQRYEEECRRILACASARFWKRVQKGYTEEQERCEKARSRYIDDLMTLHVPEAHEIENVKRCAPSLDTASKLRQQYQDGRRECHEQGLQDVFTLPKNASISKSPESTFRDIVERSKQALASSMLSSPPKAPQANSRRFAQAQSHSDWIATASGHSTSSSEEDSYSDASESCKSPVPVLLRRMSDLSQAHPELDNVSIREQLEAILSEMKLTTG
ncbi:hypothetical protein CBS12448_8544 [Aspergillus niger]|nr:hypothetical protein CBS11350_6779 [Aspergillus niger]KAI2851082.1 hypothetical protein CBS12448_8544 [Aspergillus niger]KAI2918874.1 hypothetical protein CBS147371_3952 [Aspergillus niger]KAI2945698.1 hypothetical protein CBS147322_7575 [Aspergillus niger]KAI2973949.1 hypothetical protein CBS147324_3899 [Aspergillus niger]